MKLVHKVSLFNIISSLTALALASIVLFIFFDRQIKEDIYNELQDKLKTTIVYLKEGVAIATLQKDKDLTISSLSKEEIRFTRPHHDKVEVVDFDEKSSKKRNQPELKNSTEKARILLDIQIKNQWYRISVTKSKMTPDSLFFTSLISISIVFALILLITILGNWYLFKRLFEPFYVSLNQLISFDVAKNQTLVFKDSSVDEFSLLNDKLSFFIKKTQKDYTKLKEFSENASHELQTPIAIIKSKLNLLQQSENLGEKDLLRIEEIQKTLQKTSNLNKALLLINKIENNEFVASEEIEIKTAVELILKEFSEIIQLKEIKTEIQLNYFLIRANPYLIELLLRNLIYNAIKHNTIQGKLIIIAELKKLTIINNGRPLEFPAEHYFERFKKGSHSLQSTGLGLAIVKQICKIENIAISYENVNDSHKIQLFF